MPSHPQKHLLVLLLTLSSSALSGAPLGAGEVPVLTLELITDRVTFPVGAAAPNGDAQRVFVVEQDGVIQVVDQGVVLPLPFLDISAQVTSGGERGLLGLTFHPSYRVNGAFFVYYNNLDGNTVLSRFTVSANPDVAEPTSEDILLTVTQPFIQHNGGSLHFDSDGLLLISTGDGGGSGDEFDNAQDLGSLLGKILRIDVDAGQPYAIPPDNPFVGVTGAAPEVWAYGLRNPWRIDIDPITGDLWIGDVGQGAREEISRAPHGVGGLDFGWRCMEGTACTNIAGCSCPLAGAEAPVYEYTHDEGCAVTGGAVYRGLEIPELSGTYFFADYCTGRIWSFVWDNGAVTEFTERTSELTVPGGGAVGFVSSFGRDGLGELLVVGNIPPAVYRIVQASPDPDCDGDGIPDAQELLLGTEFDVNGNNVPDSCEQLLTVTELIGGEAAALTFIGATPGQPVLVFYTKRGVGLNGPCFFNGTVCLELLMPVFLLSPTLADSQGSVSLSAGVPAGILDLSVVYFQALLLDGSGSQTSNVVIKTYTP